MTRCTKVSAIALVAVLGLTALVLLLRPHNATVVMQRISPSGKKIAVVESTLWTRFLNHHALLYVEEPGKPGSRALIGTVLNNEIDELVGLIWNPNENEIAIANSYDFSPQIVVVVDLGDDSGRVTIPKPFASGYGGEANDARAVIRTRYAIKTPAPGDMKWLAGDLANMRCEHSQHGTFLESTCEQLGLNPADYQQQP